MFLLVLAATKRYDNFLGVASWLRKMALINPSQCSKLLRSPWMLVNDVERVRYLTKLHYRLLEDTEQVIFRLIVVMFYPVSRGCLGDGG